MVFRCGNLEQEPGEASIEERLLEFAQRDWRNKAFRQMSYSKYCPPNAFCERSKGTYENVERPGVMQILGELEDNLATYAAVCDWSWYSCRSWRRHGGPSFVLVLFFIFAGRRLRRALLLGEGESLLFSRYRNLFPDLRQESILPNGKRY